MTAETVARRYAHAIFSLAKERSKVEPVGRDLHAVLDAIRKEASSERFFVSPVVDRAEKAATLARVFESKVDEVALHSLLLLVRKRREALLAPIVREYDKLALADTGREALEIVSARALAPSECNQMVARLARSYGKTFEVTQRVDPRLLGGVRITLGDRRIDGSLAGRLDQLSRELFSHPHATPVRKEKIG